MGKAAEIRREKGKKGGGVTEAGYKQILVKLNLSHQDYIFIAASSFLCVVLVLWANNFFFFLTLNLVRLIFILANAGVMANNPSKQFNIRK